MNIFTGDLVRPFTGIRAAPDKADRVAAPPYDVVTTDEARALAAGEPLNFLHVSRAEIGLRPGTDPHSDEVYGAAARRMRDLLASRALIRDPEPRYYAYRMIREGRSQTGIVFSASIDAYRANRVRRHELTRPDKEKDRARQIEAVNAITGPVQLVHRANAPLAALLARATSASPDAVKPDLDGVRHELWVIGDRSTMDDVSRIVNAMDALYIADGHHRTAAAARVFGTNRKDGAERGDDGFRGFLAVSFPDDEVAILDYNRVVADLGGRSPGEFVSALSERFAIRPADAPVRPGRPAMFGMYLGGRWHVLEPKAPASGGDPIAGLDVSLLSRLVLEPVLGIGDVRTDPRIDFVGGGRGVEAVAARVDSGEMAVGFTMFPTRLDEVMAVADAGLVMPPKSTWFDPKLADGLISQPLD